MQFRTITQYKNNKIYQEITEEDKFTDNEKDDRIYIDMRRSKGYTDELEKINCDDSGIALTISLKAAAAKKLRLGLLVFLRQNIGTYYQIRAMLCHINIIIFQKQANIKQWLKIILKQKNGTYYLTKNKYCHTKKLTL